MDEHGPDTPEARAERARELRREIDRLRSGEPDPERRPPTPHEFVEERMRELDEEDEEQSEDES